MDSASIVLLTYNGKAYLKQVIEMIRRQSVQPEKIIAIDSGSSDGTVDLLEQLAIEIHPIPKAEFSHSKTRNLAVRLVESPLIIFLTQDATPSDSCWLYQLLAPFQQYSAVAGVFSRQVARPGADLMEAHDLHVSFRSLRQVKTIPDDPTLYKKHIWDYIRFSNSSAAYDRRLLLENPFNENLQMGEDQEWAKRMLDNGLKIVYESDSIVLHSHSHTLQEKYDRNLEMGKAFSSFLGTDLGRRKFPLPEYAYNLATDFFYISSCSSTWRTKIRWLALSPIHRAAMHYAFYKGWNSIWNHRSQQDVKKAHFGAV